MRRQEDPSVDALVDRKRISHMKMNSVLMTAPRKDVVARIEEVGVVAVVRVLDASAVKDIVDALIAGGVRALEVTMTVPRAIELIGELAPQMPSGFLLGAGTVVDAETVRRVVGAGARFVVSPVFRPDIVTAAHQEGVTAIPGCFTPTEILNAWEAGADLVKVFPATSLGPGYLRDVRGPLPQVKLMPTGGVSVENVGAWLKAGAVAVGVGSALLDPRAIAEKDYTSITDRARQMVANVRAAREGS
jgi:2-dehydro-3-deoxyphosphogluconate aldolase/(4S)-4-hydroxy-2-oxoglutarate aldolase